MLVGRCLEGDGIKRVAGLLLDEPSSSRWEFLRRFVPMIALQTRSIVVGTRLSCATRLGKGLVRDVNAAPRLLARAPAHQVTVCSSGGAHGRRSERPKTFGSWSRHQDFGRYCPRANYSSPDELDRLVTGDPIDAGKASSSNCGPSYEVRITAAPRWPQ